MELELTTRQAGDVTIVDAAGKISRGDGTRVLRDFIRESVKDGKTKLLLNLTDVSYIDSAGLGVLVATVTRVICSQCKTHFTQVVDEVCPRCGTEPETGQTIVTGQDAWVPAWGEFKLLKPGKRILDLLRITKLEDCFSIHQDETTALRSFS